MKKNRQLFVHSILLLVMVMFTLTAYTQEDKKVEKKAIKVKVLSDKDGNITIDTTILIDEDFDNDWKSLIDDEEIKEKLKGIDIDINVKVDDEGHVYILKSEDGEKKTIFYTIESDDDGEIKLEVNGAAKTKDVYITKMDGDSTIKVIVKSKGEKLDGEENVIIWHSDDDDMHGIMFDDEKAERTKFIIVTKDEGGEEIKVVKKKEVIIITEDESKTKSDTSKKKKEKNK